MGKGYVYIQAGEDVSSAIECDGTLQTVTEINTPSTLTNTAFTLQRSQDGGVTWKAVFDQYGSQITIPVGASRSISIDPTIGYSFRGLIRLKGTSVEAAKRAIGFNGDSLR